MCERTLADRHRKKKKTEINDPGCVTLCELTEHLHVAERRQLVCIRTFGTYV